MAPRSSSLTALAVEALRTGVVDRPPHPHEEEIPHETRVIHCGDPDDRTLDNEYVGDELPGGSMSTPDHNLVDEIGLVYGVEEEDSGMLRSSAEILDRRDRHRPELRPPRHTR
jgi:hypothetical protein